MSQLQSRNEILLHWLRVNQVVAEVTLGEAWADLANCGGDLCQALIRQGAWTPEQAKYYLNQARLAYQSGSLSVSQSVVSGVTISAPAPILPSTSGMAHVPSSTGIPRGGSGSLGEQVFSHPDYDIDKEISRGGMGVVFKARGKKDGKAVALKVIKASSPSIEFIERFKLEARALERLDHPHIVGLHGFSWDSNRPFIAMEWVEGVSLEEKVKAHLREHGTVPPFEWTRKVHHSLAKALQYCHENGMVHRDIKPANILIEKESDRAVLVDFGLLKRDASSLKGDFKSIAEELTKSGQALGTPQFMAPEQLNDKEIFGEIGPKVDVWGLGASLYFCLVGHAPYQGSSIQIYKALIDRDPVPPGDINDQIPLAVDELCQRCLTRDSAERISMGELVKAFSNNDLTLSSHRKVSKLLWVFAVFALLLAAATVYWVSLDRKPPKLKIPVTQWTMGREPIVVSGSVDDENGSHVLIQWEGKTLKVPLNESNEFSLELNPPKKVKAALKVVAFDQRGNKSEGVKVIVKKDIVPPTIALDTNEVLVTYAAVVTIEGRCSEDESQIFVEGEKGVTVKGGRFSVTAPVELGESSRTLICIDPFGNETRREVKMTRRPRLLVGDWKGAKPSGGVAEYRTVEEALAAVQSRSQIMIAPGRYAGEMTIPESLNTIEIVGVGKVELVVRKQEAIRVDGRGIVFKSLIISPSVGIQRLDKQVVRAFRLVTVGGVECTFENCEINESPGVAIFLSGPSDRKLRKNYDLILRNCSLNKNQLSGVQAESQAHLLIENCQFIDGAYIGIYGLGCVADVRESLFKNNLHGSAIQLGSKADFRKCKFLFNDKSGLDVSGRGSQARFVDCHFEGNGKNPDERNLYDRQIVISENAKAFGKNSVIKKGYGTGVIARENAVLELTDCKVLENYFCGVSIWGDSTGRLVGCEISKNGIPKYAGGSYHGFGLDARNPGTTVLVKDCQFIDNFAKPIFQDGRAKVNLK